MTEELIALKGDDYGTLANTMLSLCEGHPAALAIAAASAVVSRLIGTCSVSESEAVLQAKQMGEQIVHNARIDWHTAHDPKG